jgi:uncharacterized membrane protein YgdD (TMEM256/DUF423 family)
MHPIWTVIAAVSGFLAVAAGAFGAHGLKRVLSAEALVIYETAVRYHMYHALALLAVAAMAHARPSRVNTASGCCLVLGTVIFSGTLYAMALGNMRFRWLGAITPIGGVLFLAGWLLLAFAAMRPVR